MKHLSLSSLIVAALLFSTVWASAQTVESYLINVKQGGTTVVSFTLPASSFNCGLLRSTPILPVINPTQIVMEDPNNQLLDCVYVDPVSGPLRSIPVSPDPYVVTAVAVSNTGLRSAESDPSNPFSIPGLVPATPTGIRLIRP